MTNRRVGRPKGTTIERPRKTISFRPLNEIYDWLQQFKNKTEVINRALERERKGRL